MMRHILWSLILVGLVVITTAVVTASSTDNATDARFNQTAADAYAAADPSAQADPVDQVAQAAPGPARAPAPDLRRRLNLTEEQARRVEQIMATFRSQTERLRIDLARARLDAREAFLQATPDRARLETIARRMGDLQGQLTKARFDMMVELKSVLNAEQWNRLRFTGRPRGMLRGRFR